MELADRRMFVLDDVVWDDLQAQLSRPAALPRAMIELPSTLTVLE
jgi:hypothetical protein